MNRFIQLTSAYFFLAVSSPVMAKERESATESSASAELSVPPLDHVEYPESRPIWCDKKTDFTGDDDVIIVVAGPCETAAECDEDLKWMVRAAIATYAGRLTNDSVSGEAYSLSDEQLVASRYRGTVVQGGQVKHEHAVELKFTPEIQSEIRSAWRSVEVGRRLAALGVLGFAGFVVLVCTSGVLGIASRRIARKEAV